MQTVDLIIYGLWTLEKWFYWVKTYFSSVKFKDPEFAVGYVFKAVLLPGAKWEFFIIIINILGALLKLKFYVYFKLIYIASYFLIFFVT